MPATLLRFLFLFLFKGASKARATKNKNKSKGIEDILIIYISYFGDTDENGQRKAFEL